MKKVLIFYASYGGGHLSAAKSIQEFMEATYGETETELMDCMKYINKTLEKMTTAAYREMAKKFPWAWGKVYSDSQKGPLAHISSRSNKIMAIKLLKLLRKSKPDLIISTHPFGSQMCSYLKRKGKINSQIATILTDFALHDQWLVGAEQVDSFFVSNEKMKEGMVKKGLSPSKIFVTGIPISNRFLVPHDTDAIYKEFGLQKETKTILFFGGGEFGLGKTKTLDVFRTFVNTIKEEQMIAIAGKNEKMKASFEEIVAQSHLEKQIKVLSFTNKVPELMSISDMVVTKPGGLTTSESLASGLPMIIINPIPGQEEENATFLEESGVGIWLKKGMDKETEIVKLLKETETLAQMKLKVELLAKKHATQSICDILLTEN